MCDPYDVDALRAATVAFGPDLVMHELTTCRTTSLGSSHVYPGTPASAGRARRTSWPPPLTRRLDLHLELGDAVERELAPERSEGSRAAR